MPTSLTSLPAELIDHITQYLPTPALASAYRTSKAFRQTFTYALSSALCRELRWRPGFYTNCTVFSRCYSHRSPSPVREDARLLLGIAHHHPMREELAVIVVTEANLYGSRHLLHRLHLPALKRLVLKDVLFKELADVAALVLGHEGSLRQLTLIELRFWDGVTGEEWRGLLSRMLEGMELEYLSLSAPYLRARRPSETDVWRELAGCTWRAPPVAKDASGMRGMWRSSQIKAAVAGNERVGWQVLDDGSQHGVLEATSADAVRSALELNSKDIPAPRFAALRDILRRAVPKNLKLRDRDAARVESRPTITPEEAEQWLGRGSLKIGTGRWMQL